MVGVQKIAGMIKISEILVFQFTTPCGMQLFEMFIFIIRMIWVLPNIWLMDDFEHHMTKCLKAVLSLTFSGVIIEKCALNNLLCYYTKKMMTPRKSKTDVRVSTKSEEELWLSFVNSKKGRSSRSQIFFKIGVLKNFANFTGKHLC